MYIEVHSVKTADVIVIIMEEMNRSSSSCCLISWVVRTLLEQKKVVSSFIGHDMFSCVLANWVWEDTAYMYVLASLLPWTLDHLRDSEAEQQSIVLVVSPLVTLMDDQSMKTMIYR